MAKTFVFGQTTYLPSIIVSVFKQVVHSLAHISEAGVVVSFDRKQLRNRKMQIMEIVLSAAKEINIKNSGFGVNGEHMAWPGMALAWGRLGSLLAARTICQPTIGFMTTGRRTIHQIEVFCPCQLMPTNC